MSILSIKSQAAEGGVKGNLHVQVKSHEVKQTNGGKPFLAIGLVDATGDFVLRVWNDHSQYAALEALKVGAGIEIAAEFKMSDFGLEAGKYWSFRGLTTEELESLLRGAPELIAKQQRDWEILVALVKSLEPGPLWLLAHVFIGEYEEMFRRAAAARGNHHARRGGLVEHVSMMMQAASVLCGVYSDMHRDLVLTAILFHDCGKLWENQYEERGFVMPFTVFAECYGHIAIGVQLVHTIWKKHVAKEESVVLRDLLCHLILAHHGELAFGSPVTPKLPEGYLVHFVDNLDAKNEMMRAAYAEGKVLAPGLVEAKWPLKGTLLVRPRGEVRSAQCSVPSGEAGSIL